MKGSSGAINRCRREPCRPLPDRPLALDFPVWVGNPYQGANEGMKRSCRTCRWFRPDSDGQTGICTNPELEDELGLQATVRGRELHCRQGWNNDRWAAAADDIVLEIRVKSPALERADRQVRRVEESVESELRTVEAIVRAWDEPTGAEANPDSPRP